MFSTEIDNRWPTSGAPVAAPPSPAEGVCNYYVTRKRRYCKMLVKTGARSVQSCLITNTSDVMLCSYCGEHLTCDSERVPCPYDPGTGCAIIIPCCYTSPGQVTPAQPAVWTSTSRCVTPGLLTSSLATLCMGSTWDLSPPGGVDWWQIILNLQ